MKIFKIIILIFVFLSISSVSYADDNEITGMELYKYAKNYINTDRNNSSFETDFAIGYFKGFLQAIMLYQDFTNNALNKMISEAMKEK